MKREKSVSAVLGERDPDIIRWFPFLSRQRQHALARVQEALNVGIELLPVGAEKPTAKQIVAYSTRTLNMIVDAFEEVGHDGIVELFKESRGQHERSNEMSLRALLSFRAVLLEFFPKSVHGAGSHRRTQRSSLEYIMRHAKTFHSDFMRHEDLSVLTGDDRVRYEALLIVLLGSVGRSSFNNPDTLSQPMAELILSRPENVREISKYQQDRRMPLKGLDPDAVTAYLDHPASALRAGSL